MRDDAIASEAWHDLGLLITMFVALSLSVVIASAAIASSMPTVNSSPDEICLDRAAPDRPAGFSEASASGEWSWLPLGVVCE
jgi:hypothetical protein